MPRQQITIVVQLSQVECRNKYRVDYVPCGFDLLRAPYRQHTGIYESCTHTRESNPSLCRKTLTPGSCSAKNVPKYNRIGHVHSSTVIREPLAYPYVFRFGSLEGTDTKCSVGKSIVLSPEREK